VIEGLLAPLGYVVTPAMDGDEVCMCMCVGMFVCACVYYLRNVVTLAMDGDEVGWCPYPAPLRPLVPLRRRGGAPPCTGVSPLPVRVSRPSLYECLAPPSDSPLPVRVAPLHDEAAPLPFLKYTRDRLPFPCTNAGTGGADHSPGIMTRINHPV
jgi:hypothetical protein